MDGCCGSLELARGRAEFNLHKSPNPHSTSTSRAFAPLADQRWIAYLRDMDALAAKRLGVHPRTQTFRNFVRSNSDLKESSKSTQSSQGQRSTCEPDVPGEGRGATPTAVPYDESEGCFAFLDGFAGHVLLLYGI